LSHRECIFNIEIYNDLGRMKESNEGTADGDCKRQQLFLSTPECDEGEYVVGGHITVVRLLPVQLQPNHKTSWTVLPDATFHDPTLIYYTNDYRCSNLLLMMGMVNARNM
jgi:hypothetical protein